MQKFLAIYKKEMRYYLQSITAYVSIAVFLAISGYFFSSLFKYYNFLSLQLRKTAEVAAAVNIIDSLMRPLFNNMSIILLLLLPLLTMRLFSEEKKEGTYELLMTYPVKEISTISGKYLSALTIFIIMLAGTLLYPILLAVFADPEWGPVFTGYLGLFLLGASFISVGIFFSSLSDNQLVSGTMTFGMVLFLLLVGWLAPIADSSLFNFISELSLIYHFNQFAKGIVNLSDITYYIFLTFFFLFLCKKSLDSDRWRA
ncbi:MAG: ABC transporter permease [Candidatus Krumholzibacteriales bacterium]